MTYRIVLFVGLVLLATTCTTPSSEVNNDPIRTVEEFYYWYLGYPGNVMAEGAYHDHNAISENFVQWLDNFVSQRMRYDPILCAQSVPDDYHVLPGNGDRQVIVETIWNAGTDFEQIQTMQIDLVRSYDTWQIEAIICPSPD